ncbi:hypothetical protein [Pedobacter rhizosphaerae]|uniref:Uncharacterized protein n=1 Tax=Pedobacter rhizosphaerae TaxID=390241 RepID=A0A1H9K6X4_9SPHI|nr:hypothetical protein [Pedobacter rhizosphaerae]SEQ94966.1 hypothetical protein SAMN04488023_102248 [Pedobacter rhizosphaerae]
MVKKYWLCIFVLAFSACSSDKQPENTDNQAYFDLPGYFKKEIARLQKIDPQVNKTVVTNGRSEQKNIKIADWAQELAIFVDADINKTSWRGSFSVSKTDSTQRFTSDNKKIRIKELAITNKGTQIKRIEILVAVKNILYTSTDTLIYCPDSLYEIKKQQKIKLLSQKNYAIVGKLK